MRKLLIGFVGVIILVVAGVLVGPSFIDWNSYKADISAQVKSLTGRDLVIDGNVSIAVLPSPAVVASDVMLSNVAGGSSPQMVQLKSLAVSVALGPLLSGDIQVTKVRLVEPVVILEVLADGSQNWVFESPDARDSISDDATPSASIDLTTGQQPSPDISGDAAVSDVTAGPGLQLDNFEVADGTVIYRDATTGMEERAENLNATFKAASLSGPFESIGSLTIRGIPLAYELGVDGVFQGRTVPISGVLRSDKADASVAFNGNIVNLSDDAKFTGTLKASGQSLAGIMSAVAQTSETPGGLNQPFSAEGEVTATVAHITVDALTLKLGDTSASGTVNASLSDIPSLAAEFTVNHVNLDKFLTLPAYTDTATASPNSSNGASSAGDGDGSRLSDVPSDRAAGVSPETAMAIPDNIAASLAIGIDAITYRSEKVGPVRLNAELANGEITLSQFSTQLPGATDVAMFGFVSMADGSPVFEGEAEISVGDTRSLTRWLQIDMPALPNGRLRHVNANANIKATAENVQISGIDVAFDGSRLTGGVTVALRKRPAFGARFMLDRIDLDGYLPRVADQAASVTATPSATETTGTANTGDDGAGGSGGTTQSTAVNPLSALSALTTFDANMDVTVGEVIHQGVQIRNVAFDGTLFNGALTVKKASVGDLAGASASVTGSVTELGGNPQMTSVAVNFKAKSMQKIADFLALDLPVPAKSLGAVASTINLDGPVLQPSLQASLNAAGAKATFDGTLSMLPLKDMIDGDVTFEHDNVAKLLRTVGVEYQPSGKIGGVSLSAGLAGGADNVSLENLSGSLGKTAFNGSATVRLRGRVPKIVATLNTSEFTVDPFMPAQATTTSSSVSTSTGSSGQTSGTASGSPSSSAGTSGAPWSHDPIDLSALGNFDGDFRLHSDAIVYDGYQVEDADVVASLSDGVLKLDHVTGAMFGGRLNVKGLLNSRGVTSADATASFENANVSRMMTALLGEPSAAGLFTLETALNVRGDSVADMVAAMDGNGSFMLKGLDVKSSSEGTAFAGVMGLVEGLGKLGAGLAGQSSDGLADATGSFVMNKGVAQINDFRLASGMGNGSAAGRVDLANWQMDVSGVMKVAESLLGQILVLKAGAAAELPFTVSGALDSPTIKLETALLGDVDGGSGLLPGLDKLDEKVPGVGGLLQGVLGGVLGGGTTQQQQPAPQSPQAQPETQAQPESQTQQGAPEPQPQPQPQQAPESQPLSPENVLKQLLQF